MKQSDIQLGRTYKGATSFRRVESIVTSGGKKFATYVEINRGKLTGVEATVLLTSFAKWAVTEKKIRKAAKKKSPTDMSRATPPFNKKSSPKTRARDRVRRPARGTDIVFTFDTTGSMYPCLTQVRRTIDATCKRLFRQVPNVRIGIIAHGDYCDEYVTKQLDLTRDETAVSDFVRDVEPTSGGDWPECYELVLNEARSLNWSSGRSKVLVMFGDAIPHEASHYENTRGLDWGNECGMLKEAGIAVYAVQCLNNRSASNFWNNLAALTDGVHLTLDQFANAPDIMTAVGMQQAGLLGQFEQELVLADKMNRNLDQTLAILRGDAPAYGRRTAFTSKRFKDVKGLNPVPAGRFQILGVDSDSPIREFAEANGLVFGTGRGFYQFTKRVKVQEYKEVILVDNESGDLYYGKDARKMLGLPAHGDVSISPKDLDGYTAFIQSTSYNRKLLAGTKFLYEVEDYATAGLGSRV